MSEDNGSDPGLWQMAKTVVRAPFERRMEEVAIRRNQRLQMEASSHMLEQIVRRVQPEDDAFTSLLTGGADRQLDAADQETLRDRAIRAYLRSPHLRGYLRSLLRFVMGEGPTITLETDDERLAERVEDEVWKPFRKANNWDELEDEIPLRTWRDGETFIRGFDHTRDGPPDNWEPNDRVARHLRSRVPEFNMLDLEPAEMGAGTLLLRLVPPEQVRDPFNEVPHGVVTSGEDAQTILGYLWSPDEQKIREVVPASDMMHLKIGVDADVLRGRSLLEVLLKRNKQYEDWLEYRIMLNLARTAVVLIKKFDRATPGQVGAMRDAQATERRNPSNDRKLKTLKPMTTIHATGGIDYEFKSPNLDATDAQKDGRSILLSEAAATGMPEYIFTGDASNSNFASTMVAESPAVREFQSWQDYFAPKFAGIFRWALATKLEHSTVEGLSRDSLDDLKIKVTFPPMLARDELQHAQALQILHQNNIISREGWAEDEGIEWGLEKERMEQERDEAFDLMVPGFGRGDDGNDAPPARPTNDPETTPDASRS